MPRLLESLLAPRRPAAVANGNGSRNGHEPVHGQDAASAERRLSYVVSAAETADCTCPDFCERDHSND